MKKTFYDILLALRDQYNFEYGTDREVDGIVVNDKCKSLAKKVKEIIDVKSSFADWLNNQNVREQLKFDIKICLIKNGYPPQYSPEVFSKVMEQVENFEEHAIVNDRKHDASSRVKRSVKYDRFAQEDKLAMVADETIGIKGERNE